MVQAEELMLRTGAAAQAAPVRKRRWRRKAVRFGWGMAFSAPAAVLYGVFVVLPLVTALWYGLYRWSGTTRKGFAGSGNFHDVLFDYPFAQQFWSALWHNAIFFVGTMAVENTLGLLLAVVLHRIFRGKRAFQTLISLPYLISPLIIGYLWTLILSPNFGPVNAFFNAVGLHSLALPWLGEPQLSMPLVIAINAWQWVGCPMLIFGAALTTIPHELEEAAMMDGAGAWKAFWRIRFPLLMPAVGVVTILTFIGCFNAFDLVYALGGSSGGPAGSMDLLGLMFYRIAFLGSGNNVGLSSAMAMIMFVLIFGFAITADRVLRRREAQR